MTLQTTGPISLGDIGIEFEDVKPNQMSEFYNKGGVVPEGTINASMFYGTSNYQIILQTHTFEVYTTKTTIIPFSNILDGSVDEWSGGNDPLTIISVQNPVNGSVLINGVNVEFTSTGGVGVSASFSFTARNSRGNEKIGQVNMNVTAIPPIIANPDTYDLQQGETLLMSKSNLAINDVDGQSKPLTVDWVGNAVGGTVSLNVDTLSFASTGLSGQPAQFDYRVTNGTENQTGKVYINITPLPEQDYLLYNSYNDAYNAVETLVPPTVLDIFETWGRFNGATFHTDKAAAIAANDSNATAWQFLTSPDRVSMPLNVTPANGFISPDYLDNYTFEATLSSVSNDNDTNGLVVAYEHDGTNSHVLALMVSCGGSNPDGGYALVYFMNDSTYADIGILAQSSYLTGSRTQWNNGQIRLKIQRQGDIITCYGTNWDDVGNYQISSEIVYDLNSNANTQRFIGPHPYGYMTFSQPDSTYLDILFSGGAELNKVFDAETGQVWEFIDGRWVSTARAVQDDVGFIRKVRNPETNQRYIVKEFTIEYLGMLTENINFDSNKILNEDQLVLISSVNNSAGAPISTLVIGLYEVNKEEINLLFGKSNLTTTTAYTSGNNSVGSADWFINNNLDVNTLGLVGGYVVFANGVVGSVTSVTDGQNPSIAYTPTTDYELFDKLV